MRIGRKLHSIIEAHIAKGKFGAFGILGKLMANGFESLVADDETVHGLIIRSYSTLSAVNGMGAQQRHQKRALCRC